MTDIHMRRIRGRERHRQTCMSIPPYIKCCYMVLVHLMCVVFELFECCTHLWLTQSSLRGWVGRSPVAIANFQRFCLCWHWLSVWSKKGNNNILYFLKYLYINYWCVYIPLVEKQVWNEGLLGTTCCLVSLIGLIYTNVFLTLLCSNFD